MNNKIVIAAVMLAFAPLTLAEFVTVSRAYELEPELVHIPLSPASSMLFRNCEECAPTSGQLTANTRFSVDGDAVNFEEFCDAMRLAKQSELAGIFLLHHLESNEIESVSVAL